MKTNKFIMVVGFLLLGVTSYSFASTLARCPSIKDIRRIYNAEGTASMSWANTLAAQDRRGYNQIKSFSHATIVYPRNGQSNAGNSMIRCGYKSTDGTMVYLQPVGENKILGIKDEKYWSNWRHGVRVCRGKLKNCVFFVEKM